MNILSCIRSCIFDEGNRHSLQSVHWPCDLLKFDLLKSRVLIDRHPMDLLWFWKLIGNKAQFDKIFEGELSMNIISPWNRFSATCVCLGGIKLIGLFGGYSQDCDNRLEAGDLSDKNNVMKITWKITKPMAFWYSSESSKYEFWNEHQHDRVWIVWNIFAVVCPRRKSPQRLKGQLVMSRGFDIFANILLCCSRMLKNLANGNLLNLFLPWPFS